MLDKLLVPGDLGEIFDAVCSHVCTAAWEVLASDRDSEEIVRRLQKMIREDMAGSFVLQPEKRRHSAPPRLPLSVISLDKVCGDPQFKDLYIRVGVDGRILYVEGFEDDTHVDLFELREYKPMRMQGSATKTGEESSEPLQTGEHYLYTVGRTDQIFAPTPAALLDSCVREEDGSIKVFPVFRPKTTRA